MTEHLLPPEIHAQFEDWEAGRLERKAKWDRLMAQRPPGTTVVYHYVNGEPDQARGQSKVEG